MRRLLLAAVLGVFGVLLLPAPASAHAVLLRTGPAAGSTVQQAPDRVVLTFNERVRPITADIGVVAPDGRSAARGRARSGSGGRDVVVDLRESLPHGTFLVTYRVISADSHPVAGGFSFSLGAPSATRPATTGGGGATESPVVAVAMPTARYLGFAGAVLVGGPVLVLVGLWPRRLSRRGPARLIWTGMALIGLATAAEFYLEAPYSIGASLFGATGDDLSAVLNSQFGWAHLVRLVLLAAAVPPLSIVTGDGRTASNDLGTAGKALLLVLGLLGAGTWGYGGHPAISSVPVLTVLSDAVHLAAVAAWLGGLVMLVGFLLPRGRPGELAAVLPVWSRWATRAVVLLGATGIVQAVVQLGTPRALVDTPYGQLLIAKVVAFAVILAVASSSRAAVRRATLPVVVPVPARRTVPAPGTDDTDYTDPVWDEVYGSSTAPATTGSTTAAADPVPDAAGPDPQPADPEPAAPRPAAGPRPLDRRGLRRLVVVELAIAAVVLGLTAVLVQTTPARSALGAGSQAQNLPFSVTTTSPTKLFGLQVEVDPARTGSNDLHLAAFHPGDGRPLRVLEWKVTASLPAAGIGPVDVTAQPISDNHAEATAALPERGDWRFTFTLRTTEINDDTVTVTVPIK